MFHKIDKHNALIDMIPQLQNEIYNLNQKLSMLAANNGRAFYTEPAKPPELKLMDKVEVETRIAAEIKMNKMYRAYGNIRPYSNQAKWNFLDEI